MATFLIGLVILFVGAALYGKFCEKVFGPDDRETPAYSKQDGVDYVPMRCWKNSLINLLANAFLHETLDSGRPRIHDIATLYQQLDELEQR